MKDPLDTIELRKLMANFVEAHGANRPDEREEYNWTATRRHAEAYWAILDYFKRAE